MSGPNVMAGYWNRPVETNETLDEDGWLHTGDAARMDDEGYVWIVDRVARRAFTRRGTSCIRATSSGALMRHPAVADAGVVSDEGETRAFVVRAPGIDVTEGELIEFSRLQLEPYEAPVSITFLDRLPRNSVGKLLRHELSS